MGTGSSPTLPAIFLRMETAETMKSLAAPASTPASREADRGSAKAPETTASFSVRSAWIIGCPDTSGREHGSLDFCSAASGGVRPSCTVRWLGVRRKPRWHVSSGHAHACRWHRAHPAGRAWNGNVQERRVPAHAVLAYA